MRTLYPNPILIALLLGFALLLTPMTAMAEACGDDVAGTVCPGGGVCDGAGADEEVLLQALKGLDLVDRRD